MEEEERKKEKRGGGGGWRGKREMEEWGRRKSRGRNMVFFYAMITVHQLQKTINDKKVIRK